MKPAARRNFWIKQSIKLILGGVLVFLMLRWFEHRQVYIPSTRFDREAKSLGRPFEDVYFRAGDGTLLNGWYFPCIKDSECPEAAILLCHGNAGNISHRLGQYEILLEIGLNVFAFDYRGYGRSEGRASENGTYQDAESAFHWLREKGFESHHIVALGQSLGGGVASELAVRVPLGGIILQSSFTSIPALGKELFPWLPVDWLATIHYDTHSKLPRLRVPVRIMHSREDSLIGFHHAEANYAAANDPKQIWELSGDHNDALIAGAEHYRAGIQEFLVTTGLIK